MKLIKAVLFITLFGALSAANANECTAGHVTGTWNQESKVESHNETDAVLASLPADNSQQAPTTRR